MSSRERLLPTQRGNLGRETRRRRGGRDGRAGHRVGERGHRRRQHAELPVVLGLLSASDLDHLKWPIGVARGNGRRGDAVGEGQRVDGLQGEAIDQARIEHRHQIAPVIGDLGRAGHAAAEVFDAQVGHRNSCEKGSKIRGTHTIRACRHPRESAT